MSKNVVQLSSQENKVATDDRASSLPSVSAGERFIYRSPASEKLIEALTRSIDEQGILTIVTGGQGSGKTVLLQQILHQAGPEWELCVIQTAHAVGEKHILEQLNNRYFPHQHYDVEVLADRLSSNTSDSWPVILVDDADNLSLFALDVLLSLKFTIEEQGGRLGLVFFAKPAIQAMLSSPSLHRHDEIIRLIGMPMLTQNETTEYIDKWLVHHHLDLPQGLSDSRKQAIYRRSGGLPGQIDRLLVEAINKQQLRIPSALPTPVLSIINRPYSWVAVVMVLLLAYALISLDVPSSDGVTEHAISAQNTQQLQRDQQQTVTGRSSLQAPDTVTDADKKNQAITSAAATGPAERPPVSGRTVKQADIPVTTVPAADKESRDVEISPASPTQTFHPTAIAGVNNVAFQEPVDGTDWLLSANKGDYTIQLAASNDEKSIKSFIRQQPVLEGLSYVRIIRRGKDGYVALYGTYPTFSRAKQAIADLPASLRDNGPWIRRISALQVLLPPAITGSETPPAETPANSEGTVVPTPGVSPVSEAEPAAVDSAVPQTADDTTPPAVDDATPQPDSQPE